MTVINTNELARIAFNNKEWNTIMFLLDSYASAYLEGYIDRAKDQFNKLFNKIPLEVVSMYEDFTVFDSIKDICIARVDSAVANQETIDEGGQ